MTRPRDIKPRSSDPGAQLETVRVSSGFSARFGAIAVVGLLVAIVWVAVVGQSAPPQLVGPVEPTPGAPTPTSTPEASPDPGRPAAVAAASIYRYSVVAMFGDRQFPGVLSEDGSGDLSGAFLVPAVLLASKGTLELTQVWRTVSHDAWAGIGSWPLDTATVSLGSRREHLILDASMRARPSIENAPLPVVRGYRITVHAMRARSNAQLRIAIHLGPRGQLAGNDGIFGWPVVAQLDRPTLAPTR